MDLNLKKLLPSMPLPGLVLCVIGAIFSYLCLSLYSLPGKISYALLAGIILRIVLSQKDALSADLRAAAKTFLSFSIVLMGLSLNVNVLAELGVHSLVAVVSVIALSFLCAFLFSKLKAFDEETSLLIGIGAGICGSSAIAATSESVTSDRNKVGIALGAINGVGVLALVFLPAFIKLLSVDESASAIIIGGSLQSLGHVAAAGALMGPLVMKQSLLVKLARVSFLLPTFFVFALRAKKRQVHGTSQSKLPPYLWGFVLSVILASVGVVPDFVLSASAELTSYTLLLAMVGIGFEIDVKALPKQAPKYLFLAAFIQILQLGLLSWIVFSVF